MIDITYLDGAKQERVMHFDSYDEFERSQQACFDWGKILSCCETDL